jgi:hypothetical protein
LWEGKDWVVQLGRIVEKIRVFLIRTCWKMKLNIGLPRGIDELKQCHVDKIKPLFIRVGMLIKRINKNTITP